jgi:mannose-6-phosphate isomerase-like protein (cupin superfamily)
MCLIVAEVIGHEYCCKGRTKAMKAFRLDDLEAERAANDGAYLQFLRERHMSVGLYALNAGELDPQNPHGQDEVYFVVSGRASLTVGMETTQVARGSLVYVPAGVAHKFHHITEDLRVLVVFSPPES